jgi:hypothetical protein
MGASSAVWTPEEDPRDRTVRPDTAVRRQAGLANPAVRRQAGLANPAVRRQAGLAKKPESRHYVPMLHDWYGTCYHP